MLLAQRYVARISRRILNVLMVLATVALAGVSAWAVIGLISEQNSLATAQRQGSDSVELLSAANVLLSRAQGDLSLALVSRGTDATDTEDFLRGQAGARAARCKRLSALARRNPASAPPRPDYPLDQAMIQPTTRVTAVSSDPAIALEPNPRATCPTPSARGSTRGSPPPRRASRHAAADASSALGGLALAIPLITALAAVLALLGLRQRINEYR